MIAARHGKPRARRTTGCRVVAVLTCALTAACAVALAVTSDHAWRRAAPSAVTALTDATAETLPVAAPSAADQGRTPAPLRVQIPAIAVDSELVPLGLEADGALEVPPSGFPAGYYTGAPSPGALGPAVLAGHVDWDGAPGVFFDLHRLTAGDTVQVGRADGSSAVFVVTDVQQHGKDAFPTEQVYGDLDHAGLRLITCGGAFDRRARSYEDNVVVFAELAEV
ncbi:MAG: class F sortase, partial [Actinomycetes bacterium]